MNPLNQDEKNELIELLEERNCIYASVSGSYRQNAAREDSDVDIFCITMPSYIDLLCGKKGVPQEKIELKSGLVVDLRLHTAALIKTLANVYYPCAVEALMSDEEHILVKSLFFPTEVLKPLLYCKRAALENAKSIIRRADARINGEDNIKKYQTILEDIEKLTLDERAGIKSIDYYNLLKRTTLYDAFESIDVDYKNEMLVIAGKRKVNMKASVIHFEKALRAALKELIQSNKKCLNEAEFKETKVKVISQYFRNFCISHNLLLTGTVELDPNQLNIFKSLRNATAENYNDVRLRADNMIIRYGMHLVDYVPEVTENHNRRLEKILEATARGFNPYE